MQPNFKNEGRQTIKNERRVQEYSNRCPAVGLYNPNFDTVKTNSSKKLNKINPQPDNKSQ